MSNDVEMLCREIVTMYHQEKPLFMHWITKDSIGVYFWPRCPEFDAKNGIYIGEDASPLPNEPFASWKAPYCKPYARLVAE